MERMHVYVVRDVLRVRAYMSTDVHKRAFHLKGIIKMYREQGGDRTIR